MARPNEIDFAARVLREQAGALGALAGAIDASFVRAIDVIVECAEASGSVLVSGMGKSGLVGGKISATLASLGIPSHTVHPAEAVHGDLGRFRRQDCLIALSNSGETHEVVNLAAIVRQDGLPVVSITGARRETPSSLERVATVALVLGVEREAGGESFAAPTTSTTAAMAIGDALALAAAARRSFTNADFAKRHPGGSLGGLLKPVTSALRFRAGHNLPLVPESLSVGQAMIEADKIGRRPGCLLIVDNAGSLSGIFTDGDFRRLVLRDPGALARPIAEVMTRSPRTLRAAALVRDAVRLVREFRQDEVPVVDDANRPVGVLDVQDLVALRLVED